MSTFTVVYSKGFSMINIDPKQSGKNEWKMRYSSEGNKGLITT